MEDETEKSSDAGIIMRQAIICEVLKDGPKTMHAIGEEISRRYRKLPKMITCTWVGGKREPIESRLSLPVEVMLPCREPAFSRSDPLLVKTVGRKDCEGCRKYFLREVAPASVTKNISTLVGHGIVSERQEAGRSVYLLNQGCHNGLVVLKSDKGHLLVCMCTNINCRIPPKGKRREITEECMFYRYLYAKEPIIKVRI